MLRKNIIPESVQTTGWGVFFGSCENLTEVDIRACIGVSNVSLEQLKQCNALGDVEFIQNRFSLLDRSIHEDSLRKCMLALDKTISNEILLWMVENIIYPSLH